MHSRGFGKGLPQRRDFLSDCHQCSQSKLGMKLIRVQVIFNGDSPKTLAENKENIVNNCLTNPVETKKSRDAKRIL